MFISTDIMSRLCKQRNLLQFMRREASFSKLSFMFPKSEMQPAQSSKDKNKALSGSMMRRNNLIIPVAPGLFSILPRLYRTLEKLYKVIDQELATTGAQKMTMPVIGPSDVWKKSGRWDEVGAELMKMQDRNTKHYCLSPTHEEVITSLVAAYSPVSYKNLPIKLYQIGRKFRDEGRPKNGLLRCREFEMKDLYTFDKCIESARETYAGVTCAYNAILKRLGVNFVCVEAACGNIGGVLSHEFHMTAPAGEDDLWQCSLCEKWFSKEFVEGRSDLALCDLKQCDQKQFIDVRGIEIAHTFLLGTKYSSVFNANYRDSSGKSSNLIMGCYGIGVTRLLASILEQAENPEYTQWPRILAPYQTIIIPQKEGFKSDVTYGLAEKLASEIGDLPNMKNEVMLDDRLHLSIGQRVRQAKQNSFGVIIAVGRKALDEQPIYEVIDTYDDTVQFLSFSETLDYLKACETLPLDCL